jgi:hypothetical protein
VFSVSDPDPHSFVAWIRIPNVDPDPEGIERAKRKENPQLKESKDLYYN